MKFPEFTDDLSIVSKLGDNPGADNGLTAEGLKAKFDEGPLALQRFLNSVLIAKLNEIFAASGQLNAGLIMTGPINMNQNMLFGLADPQNDSEVVSFGFAKRNYAPSGYGLGNIAYSLPEVADANSATRNGWYLLVSGTTNGVGCRAVMRVDSYSSAALIQTAYSTQYSTKYPVLRQRTCFNGTWGEWEWVNPPMEFGVPYRTTERWDGKAVYTMLVNLGTTVAKNSLSFDVDSITNLIRCVPNLDSKFCSEWDTYSVKDAGGETSSDNAFYFLANKSTNKVSVYAVCGSNCVGKTLYVQACYTKD